MLNLIEGSITFGWTASRLVKVTKLWQFNNNDRVPTELVRGTQCRRRTYGGCWLRVVSILELGQ